MGTPGRKYGGVPSSSKGGAVCVEVNQIPVPIFDPPPPSSGPAGQAWPRGSPSVSNGEDSPASPANQPSPADQPSPAEGPIGSCNDKPSADQPKLICPWTPQGGGVYWGNFEVHGRSGLRSGELQIGPRFEPLVGPLEAPSEPPLPPPPTSLGLGPFGPSASATRLLR